MNLQPVFPVTIMAIAAFIALMVSLYALQWRKSPGGVCFILLMLAVSIYSLSDFFEMAAATTAVKITWSKISYLGIVNLAPLWLMFTISYSQQKSWIYKRWIAAFWLFPLVILGLVVTNERHGLIWPAITPISSTPGSRLIYSHGWGVWIHAAYAYTLMFIGTILLIRTAWRSAPLYRRQVGLLIAAAIIPWIGNIMFVTNLNPWPGLDLTPIAFLFTGIILAGGIYRYQIFDLVPIARNILFNNLGDGVFVLDNQNRLVDINTIARQWTTLGDEAIGCNIMDLPRLGDIIRQHHGVPEGLSRLEVGEGDAKRIFDLTISPLRDSFDRLQGRIVLLHDISQDHNMLQAERRRSWQLEMLTDIIQTALHTPDLQQMLQLLADRLGQLFDADGAFLTLWDEDQQSTLPMAAYGELREVYSSMKPKPGEKTLTESVLSVGHVLEIEDVHNTPYLSPWIAAEFPTRSMLALPLIVDQQKLGAALVAFNQNHHFSPDEIFLGEYTAGQIALAIAKTRLYEAESRRAAQLAALQSISQAVTSSLDLDQIFETVVGVLHNTFGYPYVSIYRLYGETLYLGAQVGYPEEFIYRKIPVNRGIMSRAVRVHQPQFIKNVTTDPDFLSTTNEIESEICVPLIKEQTVLGTLNIESDPQHPLTEADMGLLITFANQVVVAIDNANLFQAERDQRELSDALLEMTAVLSESLDFETVLDRLLDQIKLVVPYDSASVMLMDAERRHVHIARMHGYEQFGEEAARQTAALEFDVETANNLRLMVETRMPKIVPNTDGDPAWIKYPFTAHIRSWVGAPIIVRDQVIGFLSLDKTEPSFYTYAHAERLSRFIGHLAIAIENARLFTELQIRAENERILFAATRDLTSGLDTEAVLKAFAEHLVKALGLRGCAVSRWDPINDSVVTLFDFSTTKEYHLDNIGTSYSLVDYPATRAVIENRQPLYLSLDDPTIDPSERALIEHLEEGAMLMLPMVAGQSKQVFGIVELFRSTKAAPFSESDFELAQALVGQATIAIENSRLFTATQRLTIIDELTGLYNRRGLFELGRRELESAIRLNHQLSMLFLDIDNFKLFNDTYSYAVGDRVLRQLAKCLRSGLREIDLVGRFGGDEFIVLLPESDLLSAQQVAKRLSQAIQSIEITTDQGETNFTASFGVCQKTKDITDLEMFIERTGQALQKAKKRGRNQVALSSELGE